MNVNLQAWDNFLGRALIVFLVIEGLKTFPWVARAARGSLFYKFILNVGTNLVFAFSFKQSDAAVIVYRKLATAKGAEVELVDAARKELKALGAN